MVVCNMNTLMKALGLPVTVFIIQKWNEQVTIHTTQMLVIRKGKTKVTKIVKKNNCEIATVIAIKMVAERRNCFCSFVICLKKFNAQIYKNVLITDIF